MALTAKPSKNADLSKIDDIQNEFFGEETADLAENTKTVVSTVKRRKKSTSAETPIFGDLQIGGKTQTLKNARNPSGEEAQKLESNSIENKGKEPENLKIADLLATAKFAGVRHTSRPFTVPRSLTIDLNRLKAKFRSRDLQYTQNELMDRMLRESLEFVTANNYRELREKAFTQVKTPEQCSRRTVTLTEDTVSAMSELKADLALAHNRRFSSDEIFTTLLAVAFAPLYENNLL